MNCVIDRNGFGNDSKAALLARSNTYNGDGRFPNTGRDDIVFEGVGAPQNVTALSKFNGSSIYFDGASYIRTAYKAQFDFDSTMNFTLDFWLSTTSLSGVRVIMEQFDGQAGPGWTIYQNGTSLVIYSVGTFVTIGSFFTAINTFVHFAWVQKAGVGSKVFRNGKQSGGLIAGFITPALTSPNLSIGARDDVGLKYYWTGHIDEVRISNMPRWWSSFPVPNRSYGQYRTYLGGPGCTLLLTGEETVSGPSTFTEWSRSAHIVNLVGDGIAKDSVNKKIGVSSWAGDGSADYLHVTSGLADLSFGVSEDFTVDTWLWVDSVQPGTASYGIFTQNVYTAAGISVFAKSDLSLYMYYNGAARINSAVILPLDQWFHLAVVRYSDVTTIYVNGVQYGNTWASGVALTCASEFRVLGRQFSDTRSLHGKIDNFRVVKGRALWTAAFSGTLPTSRNDYEG